MNEEPTKNVPLRPVKKEIVEFEAADPEEEPLFINHTMVSHAVGSTYIDVGIIPLDDILSKAPEVRFKVLTRLVMALPTLTQLRDQLNQILETQSPDVTSTPKDRV
jgi:hypothetical protein